MRTIDILCPVYREGDGIAAFHERLTAALEDVSRRYRVGIMYVLDPSPDDSEEALQVLASRDQRVEVLVMSRRFGHQAALIAGMDHSNADAVVMLDSDLQHPPELIAELVRRWESGAQIVQAVRDEGKEAALLNRLGSRWFYKAFGRVAATKVRKGAADFRLLDRRVSRILTSDFREQNPFLRGLVGWVGFRAEYVSFAAEPRLTGRSNYRPATLISFALNGLFSFSKLPLRVCIVIGALVALLSILVGVIEVVLYLFGSIEVPGWASLFAAVSFLGGVQLFFLGVIGEYVGLIFDEVKQRPRYLVSHSFGRPGARERQDGSRRSVREPIGELQEPPIG